MDRQGRFLTGIMETRTRGEARGSIYRLDPDLDILFVLSRRDSGNVQGDQLIDGALFAVHGLSITGLPETRFAGWRLVAPTRTSDRSWSQGRPDTAAALEIDAGPPLAYPPRRSKTAFEKYSEEASRNNRTARQRLVTACQNPEPDRNTFGLR